MTIANSDFDRVRNRRALYSVALLAVALILFGVWIATEIEDLVCYGMIVAAALLPAGLWISTGARGIPIIPVIALGHIVYFAVPILRGSPADLGYDDGETLRAAATVSLFLIVMSVAAYLAGMHAPAKARAGIDANEGRELQKLMVVGMMVGAVYQYGLIFGWFNWLASYGGLLRAVILTLVSAACYLFGVASGLRQLTRRVLVIAAIGLIANVILSWMSLFLVGGIFFLLSAALGYSVSAARLPWRTALAALLVIGVLHAGKQEMRQRYWEDQANYVESESRPSLPVFAAEWLAAGVAAIVAGDIGKDVSQRASLVWILLHVQRVAPIPIPYLEGATYTLLPQMLVPRFLDPGKIASQAGMNLLNVHFGILTEEGTEKTAVGWGPLAEGYANFGYFGVAAAALVVGLFGGALTAWSAGAAPVSLPALLAIAAMLQMANLEADLAYLLTSTMQSFAGVAIYYGIFRFLTRRRRRLADGSAYEVVAPRRRA
jgi:hypothetical protein